jgi:hypothetical protein
MTRKYTLRGMRAQVSRVLNAANVTRSEWVPSSRVRGWGNWTNGYYYVDPGHFIDHDDVPGIEVGYRHGTYGRSTKEARQERVARWQQRATEALVASGYLVEVTSEGTLWVRKAA